MTQPTEELISDLTWIRQSKKLLDLLNIGFLYQDMDDLILEVNESMVKLSGSSRERLIGHHVSEFYRPEEYRSLREESCRHVDDEFYQLEYFIYDVRRSKIPVLMSVSRNKDDQGHPISENVLIVDIREQKNIQQLLKDKNEELLNINKALIKNQESLEYEKRKLETILFGIGDNVSVFDLDGTCFLSNSRTANFSLDPRHNKLPLKPCRDELITLTDHTKKKHFERRVEEVKDSVGRICAYVEILKDLSDQIDLKAREQELMSMKRELKSQRLIKSEMITSSPAMKKCIDTALLCADRESTVLITGETGSGKNMIAKAIHSYSSRKEKPFVTVNCGAFPENLFESELFGHVKGSFSGAISDNIGLFRAADSGTLFLDEVGDLTLSLQVKLLRAIQEKEIRPIGSSRSYLVDVRLICATNKNLALMAQQGLFRHDLYYRIAVIPLNVPSLHERAEDILLLASRFIMKKIKNQQVQLHPETQKILLGYHWPGNVRELENVLEYALTMTAGAWILPEHLPVNLFHSAGPASTGLNFNNSGVGFPLVRSGTPGSLAESEHEVIFNTLLRCKFNQTRAAKELGISRITLRRKMSKYDDLTAG